MSQAAYQWVDLLTYETLPVMQRTLTQVRDLLHHANANHPRFAQLIARDPGFSLHIIRQFNTLPNAPEEPVNKVSLAIPLLGLSQVERACRTLPCLEDRLKGPPRRGLITCYSRAAHGAIYASALAGRRRDSEEGAVYTAALLHDIGEMALWYHKPDKMRQMQQLIQQGDGYEDAAMEIFGCTLEEISSGLSEAWHLPELVRTSQGLANSYLPRPLTVMLASALARESALGWQRPRTLDNLELLAEFLEIPLEKASAWLHEQAVEAARQLWRLPLPLPAFHLIHDDAPLKKAPAKTPEPPAAPPKEPSDKAANPLQQLITRTLQEVHNEHGLQRVMFAMLNKQKTELRARLMATASPEASLKGFVVDMTTPSLFSLLMKKPQAISLTPSNMEKYQNLIPPALNQVINPQQCLIISVFLHNKPIGLFYADNGAKGSITPLQFANFKAVCQRAIKALS